MAMSAIASTSSAIVASKESTRERFFAALGLFSQQQLEEIESRSEIEKTPPGIIFVVLQGKNQSE
jgi:hypothetical protein